VAGINLSKKESGCEIKYWGNAKNKTTLKPTSESILMLRKAANLYALFLNLSSAKSMAVKQSIARIRAE
jgi:hypothetical protein